MELTAKEKYDQEMMSMNTRAQQRNNGAEKVQEDKVYDVEFSETEYFNAQHSIKYITTNRISSIVNDLFFSVRDYEGCIIKCESGMISCDLYFHLNPNADEGNFVESIDSKILTQATSKYQRINLRGQANKLFLTDKGKNVLSKYMLPIKGVDSRDWRKFPWKRIAVEVADNQQYGQPVPLLKISNIDIVKILKKRFQYPEVKGHKYQWNLTVMRPLSNPMMGGVQNFLLQIAIADGISIEELAAEAGYIGSTQGSIPMVRPSIRQTSTVASQQRGVNTRR